jgi:four helix bundle protein
MIESSKSKKYYDLEERTFQFAKHTRNFIKKLPKTLSNLEDSRQVIRSSGSVGANYIEANESLSKKDFLYRIKIIRKEAKESAYFLRLILETNDVEFNKEASELFNEALEIKKIFSAIINKSIK